MEVQEADTTTADSPVADNNTNNTNNTDNTDNTDADNADNTDNTDADNAVVSTSDAANSPNTADTSNNNNDNNEGSIPSPDQQKTITETMAGQQHPFPTGFPNAQQNTIRNQFGGGQMVSGLMGPQQGMVSPQQFNSGVGGGGSPNPLGMLNAQQVMNQQQPMPPQLQHQQQMHLQQQQQQATLVQQNNQASGTPTTSQIPVPQSQPPVQRQANRDLNTASLCKLGQETVQEIVSRMLELCQAMKTMHPPNGTPQGLNVANDKKLKIQEQLRTIGLLFKRLRVIYEKCNENCQLQGMEYTHIESLIPIKEEWDMKSDEKKASEAYRLACEEQKEVMEQLVHKNRHLKEVIDHLRRIISEINTMMSMRRS